MNQPDPPPPADWDQFAFRKREARPVERYSPGWPAIAWTVIAAGVAAWSTLRAAEPVTGPTQWMQMAGLMLAIVAVAWVVGYGVFRASGRSELVGPITMAIVATLAIAWPFARAQWLDNKRAEESAELVVALQAADSGLDAIAHGRETDPKYVPTLIDVQLREFERLGALRHYTAGAPHARLQALREFQRERITPLVEYQLAMNRLLRTSDGRLADLAERMPQLRTDTEAFIAAGANLQAEWKDLPATFDRHLASAPFDDSLKAALRQEFDVGIAPLVAPMDALAAANVHVARADLEMAEALAARKGQWRERPGGGLEFDSQALLDRMEVLRARGLRTRRNAKIAFEQLRDVEIANARRLNPDKAVIRAEEYYLFH